MKDYFGDLVFHISKDKNLTVTKTCLMKYLQTLHTINAYLLININSSQAD